jgi:hypothetical protein
MDVKNPSIHYANVQKLRNAEVDEFIDLKRDQIIFTSDEETVAKFWSPVRLCHDNEATKLIKKQ